MIAIVSRAWRHLPRRPAALALLALLLAIRAFDPAPVPELRLRVFDLAQRISPGTPVRVPTDIVAIDQESLDRLGQWPWPRTRIAELIGRIGAGQPRALGIDILFPQPDRLSPPSIARELPDLPKPIAAQLAGLPENDHLLAEAIKTVPTVLALVLSNEDVASTAGPVKSVFVREAGPSAAQAFLPRYSGLVASLPEIRQASRAGAMITFEPDRDGIVRRVNLAAFWQDHIVPALSVEALAIALQQSLIITTGTRGIDNLSLGPLTIPTDAHGRALLHFTPAVRNFVPAWKVLDPNFQPARFAEKIVLLGVTGFGTVDLRQTPLGLMQGIEIHAQLIDSMLYERLLRLPPGGRWGALALVLLAGLLPIALIPYESLALASAGALTIVAVFLGGEFALFRFAGTLVDGSYPALTAVLIFGAMLEGHLRAAQIARRRLAADLEREREAKARLDGELTAARSIQMGLLPRRFPVFPERPDLDLFAHIEPARSVGGDLYDFMLLEGGRLFFMIADVSGKGVPAALFMAMTKEVIRDAVLRYGSALDLVLAAANTRTAAASDNLAIEGSDMMFVTAFAGTLDLASGELTFASAGHDSPFVVAEGTAPRQLETEGGPPLGAIDGFPFPVDRDRLEPGAVLVLFTDGVTEAENVGRAFYTVPRLAVALAAAPVASAKTVLDAALADLRRFVGDAEQADDITLVTLRRVGLSAP